MTMLCVSLDKNDLNFFAKFADKEWIAEEKIDGDRLRLKIENHVHKLMNRRGTDVTSRYPEFEGIGKEMPDCFVDGEMCVLDSKGLSQFNTGIAFRTHCTTPASISKAAEEYPCTFVVFDILELEGQDLRDLPWTERRNKLETLYSLYSDYPVQLITYSHDINAKWDEVTSKGGEGIVLKSVHGRYKENTRSSDWRKVKNIQEADIEVVRYTINPKGIRVETENEIACQVAGLHAAEVKQAIDLMGKAKITIRHLGWTGRKFRQPTYAKMVVGDKNESKPKR